MKTTQRKSLKEFNQKLENETYALRVGKEVPEGSVNLAYVHTPKTQSDENISLIDTSYISDNVIPQGQLESLVAANSQGELEYVDILGGEEVQVRPPRNNFPSNRVSVTNVFKKNELRTENALYYKFEIDYHYDSYKAAPNDKGLFETQKYHGQQIELTDENGNLLDDSYKYDIFVTPQALNPHIYSVHIYLHKNTNKTETIKVRYNHIDKVVKNEHIQSVQRTIELYINRNNEIKTNNQTKQMLEGGKLRIVNGSSAFEMKTEEEVRKAMTDNVEKPIFSVMPNTSGEGYKIIVPQRSESDPRAPRIFSHRVVAEYSGSDGKTVKATVGHITDWCLNSKALLKNEQEDYSQEYKNIGMPGGPFKLNAREMIEISLPFGASSIPRNAKFYVEDDKGNLLYNVTKLTDNPNVDTQVNNIMSETVEVKANDLNVKPWNNAMQNNTMIKDNPIPHRCSVIPERQKTKWDFTWEIDGEGYTERKTNYKTNWQVCANIAFKKTLNPQTLDMLDKTKWSTIGVGNKLDHWRYAYSPEVGKNIIEYLQNSNDIVGFFQRQEVIDRELINMMDKSDYQFSAKVRLTDPVDDDAIGIMFRVRDSQNYYIFVWEKNNISTTKLKYQFDRGEGIVGSYLGCDRINLNEFGYTSLRYSPEGNATESWKWTNDKSKYLNNMGFGTKHKRLFKATPSTKAPHPGTSNDLNWNGVTRYPEDQTNCEFEDITDFNASYNSNGWEYGKDYKITVVVTGSRFRVYINENVNSTELGQLVCEGIDNTHKKGSYGIASISQRWTYWYDLQMTEIILDTVCTNKKDVVLTSMEERKLSNYRVTDMMQPLIEKRTKEQFKGAPYEIISYVPKTEGDFTLRIDPINNFLYGKTNSPVAGGIVRTPWKTSENGLSVKGTGIVEYHADGHFTISTVPNTLPGDQIPDGVLNFKWATPKITSGENVKIELDPPNNVKVTASIPPITIIGKPYVLDEDEILKSNEYKHLEYLFDEQGKEGFYKKLQIPDTIPKEEILLRIERGKVESILPDGTAKIQNPEYRINYRFRCQKNGFTRLPVDQFQDQIGVNRLRLKSIMKDEDFDQNIKVDIVAWTTFQDLEAVPLFAVKMEEEKKIEIEKPKIENASMNVDNWYLRIKSGRFLKRLRLPYFENESEERLPEIYANYPELLGMVERPEHIVEVDLEYSLPEYKNQEFYFLPSVLIDKEQPSILNEYTIQTRYAPIILQSKSGRSYFEVYSIRGSKKRNMRISDIDSAKGIVYLHDRIREQDNLFVRYAYEEEWLTYKGFEKNNGTEKDFFHLDLNPGPGHRYTVAKNGFHAWIPTPNDVEPYSIPKGENDAKELLVKQIHIYARPSSIRYVDMDNPGNHGKIIPGTAKDQVLFHTDEDWWFNPKDYRYNPTFFRLGKVMIQANSSIDHMTILDTRTRGGGLDESLSREIIGQISQESLHHWDIGYFDGEAYQENGVIIVRLPRSILKSEKNPNGFHETEVQEAIAQHKAYGVLPVIEYYDEYKKDSNLIANQEFQKGKHLGYFNPSQSKGDYQVIKITTDTKEKYALKTDESSEYAITIPGYKFKSDQYLLEIRAKIQQDAEPRSAGKVEIHYKDGTVKDFQLERIKNNQWTDHKEIFATGVNIHHITIRLNHSSDFKKGSLLFDRVMLSPSPRIHEETTEIHKI